MMQFEGPALSNFEQNSKEAGTAQLGADCTAQQM